MIRWLRKALMSMAILFLFPTLALAATPLHDEPPGTVITFSGKQWVILDQMPDGTTYVLLNSNDGNRAFDPDNTQLFNPSDNNNIAYYLNNDFYNSLSQKDLIETHSWDIKFKDGSGSQSSVNCKVGLISYDEYKSYSSYYNGNILLSCSYTWWTRTPSPSYSYTIYMVNANGGLSVNFYGAESLRGVRPALYLKSGILVSETKEVIGAGEVDTTPPAVPTGLSGNTTSPSTVELTWNANTEPDFASYNVYRDGVKIKGTAVNNCTDTGLTPETTYTYIVTAVDSSGNESAHSDPITVTTPAEEPSPPEPPMSPGNITVSNVTDNSASVEWDPVDGAEGYKLYLDGFLHDTTTETFYDLIELEPETEYLVTVTAIAGELESDQSNPVSFSTIAAPVFPPAQPTFSASAIYGSGSVRLNWSLDDPSISKWEVYMNGTLINEFPSDATSTIVRELEDGTYSFKVRAVNSAGPGEFSETMTVSVTNVLEFVPKIADILEMIALMFKAIWPLMAFALALIVTPKLIRYIMAAIATRR